MNVGFIGLGQMGAAMAGSLIRAGHEVTVYNRTRGKVQALVERGAHPAAQVADACRGEALITMLADDDAVQAVVFAEGGVLQSLNPGAVHVSMSTISVDLCERLAAAHAAAGHRLPTPPPGADRSRWCRRTAAARVDSSGRSAERTRKSARASLACERCLLNGEVY